MTVRILHLSEMLGLEPRIDWGNIPDSVSPVLEATTGATLIDTVSQLSCECVAFQRNPVLNVRFGSLCKALHSDPYAQVATMRRWHDPDGAGAGLARCLA
jgi:hypothetical protein